ncbi:MAG: alpha/beta fold hydrolase [Gaiellaceae bacterium]
MPLTEAPGQGRLVEVADTRLFVVERSLEGPPLLVLHGGPGLDHWSFADYLDALAVDTRLILVDQRAQGMSDPAPRETWSLARMARDVVDLADALQLDSYAVLGHSFGGFVALRLGIDHPEAAERLVLSCTIASLRWLEGIHERIDGLESPELRERVRWGWDNETVQEHATAALEAQMPFHFADPRDPRIAEYLRRSAGGVIRTDIAEHFSANGYEGLDFERHLGEIRASTLVLAGRHDRTCPVEAAGEMAAAIPSAELVVFEQSAHMPFVEETEAYVAAVRRFVSA